MVCTNVPFTKYHNSIGSADNGLDSMQSFCYFFCVSGINKNIPLQLLPAIYSHTVIVGTTTIYSFKTVIKVGI